MGWLPEFLDKYLDPESTHKALHRLYKMKPQDIMSTLEPANYQFLLYQLGILEHKYKYGEGTHRLNVRHEMRISIASTENCGFPGMP